MGGGWHTALESKTCLGFPKQYKALTHEGNLNPNFYHPTNLAQHLPVSETGSENGER